jgi:hypothetical protein
MHDPHTEELYTIREDVMDPLQRYGGIQTDLQGTELELRLDHGKIEVPIRWRDRVSVADVFLDEGTGSVLVHMYCPACTQGLRVESHKKRIRFDRSQKRISIEKIACSYPDCDWRAVIEDNVARNP